MSRASAMKPLHRMFLQGLMSRHSGNVVDILKFLQLCINKVDGDQGATETTLNEVINVINLNIRPIHMEIKQGIDEFTGNKHYALVNTSETSIAQLSSDYNVKELEYFKKIIEEIVLESENGEISSIGVLHLVDKLEKKISKKEAQDLIERLTNDKWLMQTGKGNISLHVRAMIELEHYIKEVFPDNIVICSLCKELVMKGEACSNCTCKLHRHCAARLTKSAAIARCPECENQWLKD